MIWGYAVTLLSLVKLVVDVESYGNDCKMLLNKYCPYEMCYIPRGEFSLGVYRA
jgi:hypothetical protein